MTASHKNPVSEGRNSVRPFRDQNTSRKFNLSLFKLML